MKAYEHFIVVGDKNLPQKHCCATKNIFIWFKATLLFPMQQWSLERSTMLDYTSITYILFPSTPSSSKWTLSLRFPGQNPVMLVAEFIIFEDWLRKQFRASLLLSPRVVHSCQQKSIGLKFSKSQTGNDVRYSCHHNSSRFTLTIFAHSCSFSVLHSLQSITPRIY